MRQTGRNKYNASAERPKAALLPQRLRRCCHLRSILDGYSRFLVHWDLRKSNWGPLSEMIGGLAFGCFSLAASRMISMSAPVVASEKVLRVMGRR